MVWYLFTSISELPTLETGLTGKIHFNANGDRIAEYALKALDPATLEMQVGVRVAFG